MNLSATKRGETPLLYEPKVRTYPEVGQRRVIIRGSGEKRSLTATPVTSSDGELLMLQIILKGKSPKCIAKHDVAQLDERLFFDYAVTKTQTSIPFQRLLQEVQRRHAKRAQDMGMAPDTPCMVVIDNALSHCTVGRKSLRTIITHKSSYAPP